MKIESKARQHARAVAIRKKQREFRMHKAALGGCVKDRYRVFYHWY